MTAPEPTNDAVSDERLRELHTLREVSRSYPIGERMMQEHPGGSYVTVADYNNALDLLMPYAVELLHIAAELGEPDDPFASWEKLSPQLLNRRSVTSQASEGEVAWQPGEREMALRWLEGLHAELGSKPDYADDCLWIQRLHTLLASPSKRVERLEAALLKWQAYDQLLRTIDGTMLLGGDMPSVDALYDECVAMTVEALGGRS